MVGKFGEHEGQPRLRIDGVQFASLDERITSNAWASSKSDDREGAAASLETTQKLLPEFGARFERFLRQTLRPSPMVR